MTSEVQTRGCRMKLDPVLVREGVWVLRRPVSWYLYHTDTCAVDGDVEYGDPEGGLHLVWHAVATAMCVGLAYLVWPPIAIALGCAMVAWWFCLAIRMA